MLRSLALGASLALTASALLIPSTSVELDQDAEAKAMALAGMMGRLDSVVLKLDCASCVLEDSQQEDGSGDNALLLNFTTSGDVLLLNDAPIYPASIDFSPLRVALVDADSPEDFTVSGNSRTATSYGIQSSSSGTDSDGHQTTTVTINLYALDQSPISVDEVHVDLVDIAPAHNLVLQTVFTSPSPNSPSDPNPGNPTTGDAAYKDCAGLPALLCKWRSILAHKLSGLKPAFAFRKGCHGRPGVPDTAELKGADNEADTDGGSTTHLPTHIKGIPPSNRFGSHGHPHMHGGHHHGHGHHRGLHRFMHAFVRGFVGILIPVLVGVVAGMAATIIGMAIGQFVAFIFMWVRGHRAAAATVPGYVVVEQEDRSSMESEPLPVYKEADEGETEKGEAPPEYRDVAVVEEGKKGGE
ncbi:MAG: hypothetical protein Q9165_008105 [Trypethelium subeluteriae]